MPSPNTLANGLRTSLRELSLSILRRHVTGPSVVGEEEIVQAIQFAYEQLKLVIESSSAVALALLLRQEPQLVSKRVCAVLTGGYVDWCGPGHVWTEPKLCSTIEWLAGCVREGL